MNVLATAWFRALIGGFLVSAATGLAVYQTSNDLRAALIAFVSGFLAYLIARGGFEGNIDHAAAQKAATTAKR